MTQILSLSVENILGAESIKFAPNGQSVTIGGANGEGKSSAIWALVMALGGKGQFPEKPVHEGHEVGTVKIELDKFNVELQVSADRKQKLVVSSADGAKYQSPQAMLDKLFGGLSFDPGQFKEMEAAKRFETLRSLVGLDLSDLKTEFEAVYTERRDIGRDIKTLEGKISGLTLYEDAPESEVDVAENLKGLEELQVKVDVIAALKRRADVLQAQSGRELISLENKLKVIEAHRQAIIDLENESALNRTAIADLKEESEKILGDIQKSNEASIAAEIEGIKKAIRDADATNAKVRHNATVKTLQANLGLLIEDQTRRDKKLEDLQKQKVARLTAAKFPIEGLSIDGEVVSYNSIPFDQLSESEQWEVSTAIGFALNPKGIVFMKNCGGLDRKSRDRVRARAAASGVQLFLEVVDDADDVQILIAEGKVLENRLV